MANVHLNPMTILNFTMSIILLYYTVYLSIRCRGETRQMMLVYVGAGLWAFMVHLLVVIDAVWVDFMDWQTITLYLIRPLLFVLMCTVMAAAIKSGWRYDK
jgi:hypothetical protein